MKINLKILILLLLNSCLDSKSPEQKEQVLDQPEPCEYIKTFGDRGNSIIDTIRIENRLIDPIDDFTNFKTTDFGFVKRDGKIYKKAKTHRDCNGKFITLEYYQDFTSSIELATYKAYNDRFFTTKNTVNFWWVNSDGHLIIPIPNADPKTFRPFEDICGGTDKNGIYYGCPNFGVYKLNIPKDSKFKFVPKDNNYWNSPSHYMVVDQKVYDIKYDFEKGYFCELDNTVSINENK